jgi:competence protein ComEC
LVLVGSRTSKLALFCLFFILGNLIVARHPEPQKYEGAIIADVQQRVCGAVLVYSNKGRFLLHFFGPSPKEGERIAARIVRKEVDKPLWGEPNPLRCAKRARATRAKVQRWIPFTGDKEGYQSSRYPFVEHGGLLWSLMSGERAFIDQDTVELMRRTGTAHFLAISGMHIGFVSLLVYSLMRVFCIPLLLLDRTFLFRVIPYLCSILVAIGYAQHVGWPTSAQRSVCMVIFASCAMMLGRRIHIWTILSCTAFLVVYKEPSQWDSLGFRLSFSAVAGIVWIAPRIIRLIPIDGHPIWHRLGGSFAVSLGAFVGVIPWMAYYFQQCSWVGLFSNVVVAPFLGVIAVPCALLARIVPGYMGDVALVIGDAAVHCAYIMLLWMDVEPSKIATDGWGVLVLIGILSIPKRDVLRIVLIWLFFSFPRCVPAENEFVFLPIGQGDAVLVLWKDGSVWLIDGGPCSERLLRLLRRMGIDRLEHVFLSHPHLDHFGGLTKLVGEIDLGVLWTVRPPRKGEEKYERFFSSIQAHDITIRLPDETPPKSVRFLHPLMGWESEKKGSVNEESLVFDIDIDGYKMLFTGDIGVEAEKILLDNDRLYDDYDLVKVAHHGSRYSSSVEFVHAVQAEDVVISCGRDNRFGHPHDNTLWRWRKSRIWRTDQQGEIHLQPDRKRLWSE